MYCRLVSSSPGLHPLDTVALIFKLEQPIMSEDIAKGLVGGGQNHP